ncbi:MAG TPA: hypothetical protein VGP07_04095 [Polyangia bacterium]
MILFGGLGARDAAAAAPDTRELEAKTACLGGHADRGIELLAQLFAETNDPTYIYNQGRCFEQNGRSPEAITRFREYLRKSPGLADADRTEVQAHIAQLEAPSPAAAAPTSPAPVIVAPPSAPPAPVADSSSPPVGGADGHRWRVAGIATGAAGAAFVLGGLYMGLRARSLSNDVTTDANNGVFSRGKYDDGQRAETLQWVGYGVGIAALLGGGAMYWWGTKQEHAGTEGDRVVLLPLWDGRSAGGMARVTF